VDRRADRGLAGRVLEHLHPRRLRLHVADIRRETASTSTLRLVPETGALPPFQAGQYVNLFVSLEGIRTARPYSISSAPSSTAYYDLTVRRAADGFVSPFLLDAVRKGDRFETTGPEGSFFHNPLFHGNDLVFVAGGSGITPFMSMIREATDRDLDRRIHLIYGSRDPEDIIFREELEDRAARFERFVFTPVISEPPPGYTGLTGFITADLIRTCLGDDLKGKMFYLCGPEEMYRFCLPELERLGIPGRRIRHEIYGPPKDVTAQPGWPVAVKGDASFAVTLSGGRTVPARAGEPLMISLERAGIVVPNACRSGECSLCRTKLLTGEVFQPPTAKVRRSDRRFGYIHACVAYPLSDLEILL
jgi:ferredoxin-NADP reductase